MPEAHICGAGSRCKTRSLNCRVEVELIIRGMVIQHFEEHEGRKPKPLLSFLSGHKPKQSQAGEIPDSSTHLNVLISTCGWIRQLNIL